MYTQVGHLVFLKTSMFKESSILKISALELLAHPGFHTIGSNNASKMFCPLELKGVASVVDGVKFMCPNSCYKTR